MPGRVPGQVGDQRRDDGDRDYLHRTVVGAGRKAAATSKVG